MGAYFSEHSGEEFDGLFEKEWNGDGAGDAEPVGVIKPFAGEALPDGYLWCDGTSYPANGAYKKLYDVIGTAFNQEGDATGTFRVPDMRGRVGVGKDAGTFDALGKAGGSETQSYDLTNGTATAQICRHDNNVRAAFHGEDITFENDQNLATVSPALGTVRGYGVKVVGSTASENNLQPYLVCNYIIKYDRSYAEIGVTAPPCIWAFSDSDWQENETGGYVLNIPESEHGRGEHCVLTALYDTAETDKMKAVLFEMEKNSTGDIVIYSDTAFEGTAYIDRVYMQPAGRVLTVNGQEPDVDGDVNITNVKNAEMLGNHGAEYYAKNAVTHGVLNVGDGRMNRWMQIGNMVMISVSYVGSLSHNTVFGTYTGITKPTSDVVIPVTISQANGHTMGYLQINTSGQVSAISLDAQPMTMIHGTGFYYVSTE